MRGRPRTIQETLIGEAINAALASDGTGVQPPESLTVNASVGDTLTYGSFSATAGGFATAQDIYI